jgi:hypothetical protein
MYILLHIARVIPAGSSIGFASQIGELRNHIQLHKTLLRCEMLLSNRPQLKSYKKSHHIYAAPQHSTFTAGANAKQLICIANEQRVHHQKALFACEQRSSNKLQPQRELTAHSFIYSSGAFIYSCKAKRLRLKINLFCNEHNKNGRGAKNFLELYKAFLPRTPIHIFTCYTNSTF